jgi:hypothetical protein
LFNIRSIVTKSDRLTILRSIPPVLLSIGTVVYLVLLVGNTFPWDAQGYQGSFWWSVEKYFTFYLVMTVIGLGLEILVSVRRKRPVTQAPTDRPDTLNG